MKRAIRKYSRDFAAIIALFLIALGVGGYILVNQRLTLPGFVPLIGTEFYEVEGEFSTAQAVTPGQGQTVNVAGVEIGNIAETKLENGRAIVRMNLEKEYEGTIYKDATMLLRPKTGLKDMVVEVSPGSPKAGRLPDGGRIPISNTLPDVNLDEILASLDADTRSFLGLLVNDGAEGLKGREKDLSNTLKQLEPTAQALRAINSQLKTRRTNIRRVVNRFSLVSEQLGTSEDDLTAVVGSSNAVFSSIARQDASLRETLRELPPALESTREGLGKARILSDQLGPTLDDLNPTARALAPTLRAVRPLARQATPILRDEIRPFTREAQPLVRDLRPAARDLARLTPDLRSSATTLNKALNGLAYNPPGPKDEGYLFWLAWTNHLGGTIFNTQDAHGPIRRGILSLSCSSAGILDQVSQVNQSLATLVGLLNAPTADAICNTTAEDGASG